MVKAIEVLGVMGWLVFVLVLVASSLAVLSELASPWRLWAPPQQDWVSRGETLWTHAACEA